MPQIYVTFLQALNKIDHLPIQNIKLPIFKYILQIRSLAIKMSILSHFMLVKIKKSILH